MQPPRPAGRPMTDERRKGDRGGGLHVQGGLRIRNLTVSFDPATGDLVDSSMITEVRTDTFHHWLQIAAQASDDAADARNAAIEAGDDDEVFNRALEREFRASMIAVAAAAFAVDAFYGSVLLHAPQTRIDAKSRDGSIFETLKHAFSLSGERQAALREPLRVMFRLRDRAVHPRAAWVAPTRHPVFNLLMEPRFVEYTVENAVNAQLLARRLIWACLQAPKREHIDLAAWCEALKDSVAEPPPSAGLASPQ